MATLTNTTKPTASASTQARETLDALYEVSRMLNTGLDKETLGLLVALCEAGVNPEALAHGIRELHRVQQASSSSSSSSSRP